MVTSDSWREDLETWLAPFLAELTHPAQRRMCPAYIAGLIGPGDRKSIQPLAARTDDVGYDQLHHFIASGTWDAAPFENRLLTEADRLVGDAKGYLVIDDTALPKKGRNSVGVAPQYASSQGKTANCQSLVSVTLASREVPVMVGLRLFLPESWTDDPVRMKRARVPSERQAAMSKPDIAIAEIDRVITAGTRFGCVLADAGYGSGAAFRQALSERNLLWAVGLSSRQTVYAADVELTFPTARGGRPRKYHIPDQAPVSVADMLPARRGGRLHGAAAPKDGSPACSPPGGFGSPRAIAIVWPAIAFRPCLVRRSGWSANAVRAASANTTYPISRPIRPCVSLPPRSRHGGSVNKAHQQLKEELGLDHFEGRSWPGLHRHALMTMLAYAFLQSRRLKAAGRKKKSRWTAPATDPAGDQTGDPRPAGKTATYALPTLSKAARDRHRTESAKVVLAPLYQNAAGASCKSCLANIGAKVRYRGRHLIENAFCRLKDFR